MNHVWEADGIQFEQAGRTILSGVYLTCETGKITGLLGRNGQGKSCLMNIIYGSLHCGKSVRFDGVAVAESFKRPDLMMYLPQVTFLPQSITLRRVFRDFDVDYNGFQQKFPEFAAKEKMAVGNLSGGARRLVELYVIVKAASQFAMLDEPFTHLSPVQIEKVKELLQEEKHHKGWLVTDHLFRHVTDICDRLYILSNGQTYPATSIGDINTFGYAG